MAGAPVIITLRSGTAFAVSAYCYDKGDIAPPDDAAANLVIDSLQGRSNIMGYVPGMPDNEVIDIVRDSAVIMWPPQGEKDVYYLAAAAPSCYTSFCGDPTTQSITGCPGSIL